MSVTRHDHAGVCGITPSVAYGQWQGEHTHKMEEGSEGLFMHRNLLGSRTQVGCVGLPGTSVSRQVIIRGHNNNNMTKTDTLGSPDASGRGVQGSWWGRQNEYLGAPNVVANSCVFFA